MNSFNRRKFLKTTGAIALTSTLSFELDLAVAGAWCA